MELYRLPLLQALNTFDSKIEYIYLKIIIKRNLYDLLRKKSEFVVHPVNWCMRG